MPLGDLLLPPRPDKEPLPRLVERVSRRTRRSTGGRLRAAIAIALAALPGAALGVGGLAVAGCTREPQTVEGAAADTLTGEALLDALWQREQRADGHSHSPDTPEHDHGGTPGGDGHRHVEDDHDGHDGGHGGGHGGGGHFTPPEGACAAGTWSTLHVDCIGNTGCKVNPIAPCSCGCEMCWQEICVELACEVTPGCPDGG